MRILIKDMELPKHCAECGMEWCEKWRRLIIEGMSIAKSRPYDCPLIELPPHGRLIDVGDVNDLIEAKCIEFMSKERHENCHVYEIGYRHGIEVAKAAIANSLTIIEAEEGEA